MISRRMGLRALLAVAAAQVLAFMPTLSAQAQSGSLTVYSSQASATNVVDLFEKKYPDMDVTLLHMVAGPIATRFANEAQSGVNAADVLLIATPSLFLKNPEWFLPLKGAGLPAYDNWSEKLKTDNYVKAVFGKAVVFYNQNEVEAGDAPKTWRDLLDPRWKGRIAMIDPASSDTYLSWALNLRKAFGDQFLIDLGKQELTIAKGGIDAAQAVASGSSAISVPPFANHATKLLEQGAPIGIIEMGGPTLGNETSIGLAAKAPNPENAKLFFDFYLSAAGQAAACGGVSASGLGEVEGCKPLPADFVPPSFDIPEAETQEILTLLGMR